MWYLKEIKLNKIHKNNILNKILHNRGINTKVEAQRFIKPNYLDLKDPYLLKDLKNAVQILIKVIQDNKKILIYGDYDVDGITSTALLINFFKDIGFNNFDYYIPNRLKEGYGLSLESLHKIKLDKFDLVITVDCGITAVKEVEYLKKRNIKVIITDHHKLKSQLPPADAVIDPQRNANDYFKVLAGVGVAYKLIQAVDQKLEAGCCRDHLDLVGLGTVADIVPLKNDNRIMVKEGLDKLKKTDKIGLKKLLEDLGLSNQEINPGQIGYIIAPPINAIGRMEEPEKAVELLTTNQEDTALRISKKLIAINKERQRKEKEIHNQALKMVKPEDIKAQNPIVLAAKNWHRGVIGIVASRLVERYYLPVILIALDENGIGHGSARSINGFDITEGLEYCKEFLENYGGHSMAAGLTVKEKNINKFVEKINTHIKENLDPIDFIPGINLDEILKIDQINLQLYKDLNKLQPFGIGNPRPKFLISDINLKNHYTVGSQAKHLKIELHNGITGIAFNMGDINLKIKNKRLDLAAKIYLNNWMGKNKIELRIEDINVRSDPTYFPLTFKKYDYTIYDKRYINNKIKYIKGLKRYQKNIAIYINGKNKIKELKKSLLEKNIDILFNNWKDFKNKKSAVILFDRKFEEVIKKDTHLVMYSIPFSLKELYLFLINFQTKQKVIHLIYNQSDFGLNKNLIKASLPDKKTIFKAYNLIKDEIDQSIYQKDKIYKTMYDKLDTNTDQVNKIIDILLEQNQLKEKGEKLKIVDSNKSKLDLSNSVYYNNIIKVKKEYNDLKEMLKVKNLFFLIDNFKKIKEETDEL